MFLARLNVPWKKLSIVLYILNWILLVATIPIANKLLQNVVEYQREIDAIHDQAKTFQNDAIGNCFLHAVFNNASTA